MLLFSLYILLLDILWDRGGNSWFYLNWFTFFVSHFSIPGVLRNVWLDCSSLYTSLAIKLFYCMYFFHQSIYCGIFFFFDKLINHRKQQRITHPCTSPSETANVNTVSYLLRLLSDKTNSGRIAVYPSPAEACAGLCCPRAFSGCGVRASHCGAFSRCGALAPGHSGVGGCGTWAQQLQFPGSRAQAQSCQWALLDRGVWGLPRSGIEPMSPNWQADSLPLRHQGSPFSSFSAF